ncbi:hypothetical protein MTO96_039023 [Rhipicephalus appendiculatus]
MENEGSHGVRLEAGDSAPGAFLPPRASRSFTDVEDYAGSAVFHAVGATGAPFVAAPAAAVVLPIDDLVHVESAVQEDFGPPSCLQDDDELLRDESRPSSALGQSPSSVDSISLSSDGLPACRICFFGGGKEPLIEPCNCRGTIGFVHRDCLELWIQRTLDAKCQICHFQYIVRKQAKPAWCLLSDAKACRPVLGYLVMGVLFVVSIAFIFSLAWLYVLRLPDRIGENMAAVVVVLLSVQHFLWLYFPFASFVYSIRAFKEWHRRSATLKLVHSAGEKRHKLWSHFRLRRTCKGSQESEICRGSV